MNIYEQERALVMALGTTDQFHRQALGKLHEHEFREIVRQRVLGPAMVAADGLPLPRIELVEIRDIRHRDTCAIRKLRRDDQEENVTFTGEDFTGVLTTEPTRALEAVQAAALTLAFPHVVTVRRHVGSCDVCGASVERLGALVSLRACGRLVSREYWLA